jgi:hypothetical protein
VKRRSDSDSETESTHGHQGTASPVRPVSLFASEPRCSELCTRGQASIARFSLSNLRIRFRFASTCELLPQARFCMRTLPPILWPNDDASIRLRQDISRTSHCNLRSMNHLQCFRIHVLHDIYSSIAACLMDLKASSRITKATESGLSGLPVGL